LNAPLQGICYEKHLIYGKRFYLTNYSSFLKLLKQWIEVADFRQKTAQVTFSACDAPGSCGSGVTRNYCRLRFPQTRDLRKVRSNSFWLPFKNFYSFSHKKFVRSEKHILF